LSINTENLIREYLIGKTFAVVGVSRNPSKYGYQVFKNLLMRGKKVYPINPNTDEIDGIKAYRSIMDIPEVPFGVHFIVPPQITEKVIEDVINRGIHYVWMQPGSESLKAIKLCNDNSINVIYNRCILQIPF